MREEQNKLLKIDLEREQFRVINLSDDLSNVNRMYGEDKSTWENQRMDLEYTLSEEKHVAKTKMSFDPFSSKHSHLNYHKTSSKTKEKLRDDLHQV